MVHFDKQRKKNVSYFCIRKHTYKDKEITQRPIRLY